VLQGAAAGSMGGRFVTPLGLSSMLFGQNLLLSNLVV
jgi:hypothetical protein